MVDVRSLYHVEIYREGLEILCTALIVSAVKHLRLEYNPLKRAPKRALPDKPDATDKDEGDEAKVEEPAGDGAPTGEDDDEDDEEEDEEEEEEVIEEEEAEAEIDPNEDLSLQFAQLVELPLISLWLRGNKITAACTCSKLSGPLCSYSVSFVGSPSVPGGQVIGKKLAGHRSLVELNLADNSLGDIGGQVCVCMHAVLHSRPILATTSMLIVAISSHHTVHARLSPTRCT